MHCCRGGRGDGDERAPRTGGKNKAFGRARTAARGWATRACASSITLAPARTARSREGACGDDASSPADGVISRDRHVPPYRAHLPARRHRPLRSQAGLARRTEQARSAPLQGDPCCQTVSRWTLGLQDLDQPAAGSTRGREWGLTPKHFTDGGTLEASLADSAGAIGTRVHAADAGADRRSRVRDPWLPTSTAPPWAPERATSALRSGVTRGRHVGINTRGTSMRSRFRAAAAGK